MGITHLSGLEVAGVPTQGMGGGLPLTTNNYWFVSSVTGNNGNTGQADNPFATIDYAIGQCTANKGDTIVVLQGHAETISAAGGVAVDIAGVNIVGLGTGADRPELTFSATASTFAISAANVMVKNIVGLGSIDAVVSPFLITAAGCTLGTADGPVEWQDPSSSLQAVRVVLTDANADNLNVNLKVTGITSGGTAPVNAVRLVGCNDATIVMNFYGRASTGVVEFLTTACTNIEVYGYMYNSGTTDGSKNVVDTAGSGTWAAQYFDGAAGQLIKGGSALPVVSASGAPGAINRYISTKVIAAAGTSFTTGASPVNLFTVTGDVVARVYATVQTSLASTLNNGTLAIGVTGNTGSFLAATTADGTNLVTGAVWSGDTSPTVKSEVFTACALNWAPIAAGADIIATIATNSMTAGAITFYCEWYPVSAAATVVAA